MKNSLKVDILLILFFTTAVPTGISLYLLASNIVAQKAQIERYDYESNRQAQYTIAVQMRQIEQFMDILMESNELSSFIHSSPSLRKYTENLLIGKLLSMSSGFSPIDDVIVLDLKDTTIFSLNGDVEKIRLQSQNFTEGFNFDSAENSVLFMKKILFDDQFQKSDAAVSRGFIFFKVRPEIFLRDVGRAKAISALPTESRYIDQIIIELSKSDRQSLSLTYYIGAISMLLLGTVLTGLILLRRRILTPIIELNSSVEKRKSLLSAQSHNGEAVKNEIEKLRCTFENYVESLERSNSALAEQSKAKALADLAQQVSHDIRSPLTALSFALSFTHDLSEDKRVFIRSAVGRINDIANTLSAKNQMGVAQVSTELLPAIVDSLVSEKRIQYRDNIHFEIQTDYLDSYGAFARVNAVELKRVLSNLINNSVEALSNGRGKVVVGIRTGPDLVSVAIKDNGIGIPAEVLSQVGKHSISYGKESSQSGSGLGLLHAERTIKSFGGTIAIESKLGSGTVVTLNLPRFPSPCWFLEVIKCNSANQIIVVDDDTTIHQVWLRRFSDLPGLSNNMPMRFFSSLREFKSWVSSYDISRCLFLMDHEFLGRPEDGIDVIAELSISHQAALVTSRYEELSVRHRAERLGIKIIPKAMANCIPIEVTNEARLAPFSGQPHVV